MDCRFSRRPLATLNAGALLREARVYAGLSQAALAARLGTTQPVISRWERGVEEPRLKSLARALRACGLEADMVFRPHGAVDRAQIRAQLALTPKERLESIESVAEVVGLARV
jgi:transcriptional regulator with XRE-family HTH domain